MSNIFFTSDHHFGHKSIIKYSNRPFETVEDMDEALIQNWNNTIKNHATVYHCGDLSFYRPDKTREILYRLNGQIFFINGNHDKSNRLGSLTKGRFGWIKDYYELKIDGKKIILCHYPFATWNGAHHGNWHLHGHSHGSLKTNRPGRMDIGVDTRNYFPWSYDEVHEELKDKEYIPVDHHVSR